MALEITDANFDVIVKGDKPVVIDFWAEWCGPCRLVAPYIDELSSEYEEKVTIGKVDIEENDDIVGRFGIRTIPTILFFKGGEVVDKHVGAASKSLLEEKVKALL